MKKTKFNWKCVHCEKRNIAAIKFQFDMPKVYTVEWSCGKCGKDSELSWSLNVNFPRKQGQ